MESCTFHQNVWEDCSLLKPGLYEQLLTIALEEDLATLADTRG
jgi:hypothetical protein